MKTDRTTKTLLLVIALGLWANVASGWLRPVALKAQTTVDRKLLMRIVARVEKSR